MPIPFVRLVVSRSLLPLLCLCLMSSCMSYSSNSTPDASVDDAACDPSDNLQGDDATNEPADKIQVDDAGNTPDDSVDGSSSTDEDWQPEIPDVVVTGRLWPWPNPLMFGRNENGYAIAEIMIMFSNIGTEDVAIEDISLSGDPLFSFGDDQLDSYMPEVSPGGDCNSGSGFGTTIHFDPFATGISSAKIVVRTSDPHYPVLEIQASYDPNLLQQQIPDLLGFVPSAKPNPIRFNPDPTIGEQTIEMCISVMAWNETPSLVNVYTIGEAFAVTDLLDYQGNPVTFPTGDLNEGPSLDSATVSFTPSSANPEGGFLVFEYQLGSGQMVTLRVPILVELD